MTINPLRYLMSVFSSTQTVNKTCQEKAVPQGWPKQDSSSQYALTKEQALKVRAEAIADLMKNKNLTLDQATKKIDAIW